MKVIFILSLVLALSLAYPAKDSRKDGEPPVNRRYSLRKTSRQDAAPKAQTAKPVVAPSGVGSHIINVSPPRVAIKKKQVGSKPFGEPELTVAQVQAQAQTQLQAGQTETGSIEPIFPPKQVTEPPAPTSAAPPPTAAPTAAPVTEKVAQPSAPPPEEKRNNTGTATTSTGEDDDSSSEEDDEEDADDEEDDDDARQLFPLDTKQKTENKKITQPPKSAKKAQPNPQPYLVDGYVTETGQILVPIETFQKYFDFPSHVVLPEETNYRAEYLPEPTGYIVSSRQEAVENSNANAGSSEEESSENSSPAKDEDEVESEETAPVRVSSKPSKKNSKPKDKVVEPEAGSSEEVNEEKDSDEKPVRGNTDTAENPVSIETEEKNTSAEPIQPGPRPRPPLGAIPATRPTNEDDEAENGRHFFRYPLFEPLYDDDLNDYDNEYFYQ